MVKTKCVTFSTPLEQVYDIEGFYIVGDEDGNLKSTLMSGTGERTEEITVLSTQHGRARRYLRDIDKATLKQALKYGIKQRAHNDPRTGLSRWKFTFNNTVYITDHTCRVEITSYKEAVQIQRAPITVEMSNRHNNNARIIESQPQMCTSHTYVILDQSGSMKQWAAFGCLAIDFVSKQLTSLGDSPGADSFTLIEMNDDGWVSIDHAPLDWILFNRLLDRQVDAIPRSHGNYVPSLQLVAKQIAQDIGHLEDMDQEDYPAFFLIFLSDGKPSDRDDSSTRNSLIVSICEKLKSKLSILGMGLGASGQDFYALSSMVDLAKSHGANGEFIHAGLSAGNLAEGFSSISSTLTTVRTELVGQEEEEESEENTQEIVGLKYRESMSKSRGDCTRYMKDVRRYTFSIKRWERYDDPWIPSSFANKHAVGFEIDKTPFGKGVERLAFRFHEINKSNELVGNILVGKENKNRKKGSAQESFHMVCLRTQITAMRLAKEVMTDVGKRPSLKPLEAYERMPSIRFITCYVYMYKDDEDICEEEKFLLVESMLQGKFTKFTSNNGYVKDMGYTFDLPGGTAQATDVLQAFSHWTHFHHKMLVCDLQGVLNEEGKSPVFELTDPVICSTHRKRSFRFGKTDTGMKGIRNFGRTHRCSLICKGLGLPELGLTAGKR
eukprot:Nitzschia sp. Nitz4//scaffold16_size188269//169077//171090//NITZ4_001817-RA/size188269-snap-gene-0.151-mRNA-1//-1//CDS//3329538595//6298//frame0